MPKLPALLLFACLGSVLRAASSNTATPVAAVQSLFDAMAAHDVEAARALFMPEATLIAVRSDGTAVVTPHGQWLDHLSQSKDHWLERMWNPKVLGHNSIAIVWAEYDFHLNGKFSHCGIDSVNLLKTSSGWKISGISYTGEKENCPASPLGPPVQQ